MKEIEKGSVKYLFITIISVAICGVIIFPLFDLILCSFITNSQFVYSIYNHVVQPVVFAVFFGLACWIFDRKKSK